MGLPNDLHAAVEHAPPPRYDLDQLIRRGRARRMRSGVFATVGAFAVVGLVLTAGYATAAGFRSAGPGQVGSQQPGAPPAAPELTAPMSPPASDIPWSVRPEPVYDASPAEQANADRLTAALAQLPAELRIPTDGSVRFVVRHEATLGTYYVTNWDVDGLHFTISIQSYTPGSDDDACAPGEDPNGCAGDRDANGIMYVTGAEEYFTALYGRDDGTTVDVSVQVNPGGPDRVPSDIRSEVRNAARNPGLSLHPVAPTGIVCAWPWRLDPPRPRLGGQVASYE